jgi:hypothetical protein
LPPRLAEVKKRAGVSVSPSCKAASAGAPAARGYRAASTGRLLDGHRPHMRRGAYYDSAAVGPRSDAQKQVDETGDIQRVISRKLCADIRTAARKARQRKAAIAYVTRDLIGLRRGDMLVGRSVR